MKGETIDVKWLQSENFLFHIAIISPSNSLKSPVGVGFGGNVHKNSFFSAFIFHFQMRIATFAVRKINGQ